MAVNNSSSKAALLFGSGSGSTQLDAIMTPLLCVKEAKTIPGEIKKEEEKSCIQKAGDDKKEIEAAPLLSAQIKSKEVEAKFHTHIKFKPERETFALSTLRIKDRGHHIKFGLVQDS